MYENTYDSDKRKILSVLCHGSVFLSSILLPIAVPIVLLVISDDPVVKENAKEAINFHINVWLYGAIIGALCFVLIGYLLLPFWFVIHWSLTLMAIIHCLSQAEQPYRYPFIFRLV